MLRKRLELSIDSDGTVRFIYDDIAKPLLKIGTATITRAGLIEPDDDGTWIVDLRLVGGPRRPGFRLRQKALDFEVKWLTRNYL